MVALNTSYLGLKLNNPIVASASPLSQNSETVKQLEETGVSAVVMYSLFEEQIIRESIKLHEDLTRGVEHYAEALTYFPEVGRYTIGPDAYVQQIQKTKKEVKIPVIGSLNGISTGGWTEYAKRIESAGADALELNVYDVATNPDLDSSQLEKQYINLIAEIRKNIKIPLAIKLSPFFTSLPNFVKKLVENGADGLVLFNRFYQPDFDLEELEVVPNLVLSTSKDLRLPLRWIAILYGRIRTDFALTSGVHTSDDVLKALMAGASVTMIASEFLMNGIERARDIINGLTNWMEKNQYDSVDQMKGSMSQQAVADPAAFERANYVKVLNSY